MSRTGDCAIELDWEYSAMTCFTYMACKPESE